jgi:hypothetical protein
MLCSALQIYKSKHGDLKVSPAFEVPEDDDWPEGLWGLKLGHRVHNIKYRGDFVSDNKEYWDLLNDLGFEWPRKRRKAIIQSGLSSGISTKVVVMNDEVYEFD